tara:strand:- start:2903 stop:3094 length:192 start_codon:yes stop_codon:yes gene_type:complete
MFVFNFYNTSLFLKEKTKVLEIILPKLRKRLNEMHMVESTFEIENEIENKEILVKALKYYYSI